MWPPPPPFLTREDSQLHPNSSNPVIRQLGTRTAELSRDKPPQYYPFQRESNRGPTVQRRLFDVPTGALPSNSGQSPSSFSPPADTSFSPPTPQFQYRSRTQDGQVVDQRATSPSHQRSPPVGNAPSPSDMPQRRLSMPGDLGQGPSFSFPTMTPTSMTSCGGAPQSRSPRLAATCSGPVSGFDGMPSIYFSPALSSRPLSRATTPLHSGYPTPRSSMTGSMYGSPSDYGAEGSSADCSRQAPRRMQSGVEKGLDTPAWVSRLRLLGRLLLAGLFANMLWQELREWRRARGYGWREWYDLSWAAEEMPPLPSVLSSVALALLVGGCSTSAALGFLAARLLLQTLELTEDMLALLRQQSSNLLPVKELAVVGTVLGFIGHTYYLPDWLRGRKAKGKAKGLMYTQQWRPGQMLVLLLGQLLIAPLFISICALQYFDSTNAALGLEGWKQRLLHPYFWVPPGDSSANNWLPLQALAYLLVLANMRNKRMTAVLVVLLVAEAATCWRFWSPVWTSTHYVWYLRRHFTANMAIAGGLLLSIPEGKHDAKAVRQESAIGKKRT